MTINAKKPLAELVLRKRTILFDLDGTLVDSSGCHEESFKQAMQLHAPSLLPGFVYEDTKGLRTDDVFRSLNVSDEDLVRKLTSEKQSSYRKRVANGEVKAFPHAKELLLTLSRNGCRLALVTSASKGSATTILNNLQIAQLFEVIITGEDVIKAKPAPDGYLKGIEHLKASKEDALVVEDALSGIEAGRAAGLDVIAVNNTELEHLEEFLGTIADLHAVLLNSTRQ